MSPVSTVTCSPRAIGGSPRGRAASPLASKDGAGRRGRSDRAPPPTGNAALGDLEWWNELDFSPPRGGESSGLEQWRCVCVCGCDVVEVAIQTTFVLCNTLSLRCPGGGGREFEKD